ncbi:unnamed protein product [Arctogadus glacialis]
MVLVHVVQDEHNDTPHVCFLHCFCHVLLGGGGAMPPGDWFLTDGRPRESIGMYSFHSVCVCVFHPPSSEFCVKGL